MTDPTLVVLSGPAGTGKTTLAHRLALLPGCPAISRDEVKEGMVHAQGTFDPKPDDDLTKRTLPVFFNVIRLLVEGGVTVVAEAAFQHNVWRPRLEELQHVATIRIVQCHADFVVARGRMTERVGLRRAHADADLFEELRSGNRYFEEFERVAMPAPSLEVDTTTDYVPTLEAIAAFVNRPSNEPFHEG